MPDLFVIVGGRLIAIEMKRTAGSSTSPAQKEWLANLTAAGIAARVCKGADAAIAFIDAVAKGEYDKYKAVNDALLKAPVPKRGRKIMPTGSFDDSMIF